MQCQDHPSLHLTSARKKSGIHGRKSTAASAVRPKLRMPKSCHKPGEMWVTSVAPESIAIELPITNWRCCTLSLGEVFVLSLGTDGRPQSSGTRAGTVCLSALMGSTQELSACCSCSDCGMHAAVTWKWAKANGERSAGASFFLIPFQSLEICYWWHKKYGRIH